MTNYEILMMAEKAGITFVVQQGVASATEEWLTNFARLIAKRQREIDAGICERRAGFGSYAESMGAHRILTSCAAAILAQED
jgi:hypothetical protein